MPSNTATRVQKHRLSLRGAGLRPIQLWVPDIQAPGFIEDCRHQSALVADADRADNELMPFLDDTLDNLDGA